MVTDVQQSTMKQQMLLQSKIIHELLLSEIWTSTLEEKLSQLERFVVTLPAADFSIWSEKLIIFWKRHAILKDQHQANKKASPLLAGDGWKVEVTSSHIVVTNADGVSQHMDIDIKEKSSDKQSAVVENGCHANSLKQVATTANWHTKFQFGPQNESKQEPVKSDLYDPEASTQKSSIRRSSTELTGQLNGQLKTCVPQYPGRNQQQPAPRMAPTRSRSVDPRGSCPRSMTSGGSGEALNVKEVYYQSEPIPKEISGDTASKNTVLSQAEQKTSDDDFNWVAEAPLPKLPIPVATNGDSDRTGQEPGAQKPAKPLRSSKTLASRLVNTTTTTEHSDFDAISITSAPSMSKLAHQFVADFQKELNGDPSSIGAELKSDFAKLPVAQSENDIDSMRRLQWALTKAIRQLEPYTVTPELAKLERDLFGLALCHLAPVSQTQYLSCPLYTESLKMLAAFLRDKVPPGGGFSNGGPFCSYCKTPGHLLDNCSTLANTTCFKCFEKGHSTKWCPNPALVNMNQHK